MASDRFKLPGTSYEELAKIIRAYAGLDRDAAPAEVGNLAGKHATGVSRNNGFLVALGIIESGEKGKHITAAGKGLALALEHEQDKEIAAQWRELCGRNEFVQKIVAAVRVRKGMDRATLTSHVAYTAGQAKTKATMAGANGFVDILLVASLLREHNGKLTATDVLPGRPEPREAAGPSAPELEAEPPESHETPAITWRPPTSIGGHPRVAFEIQLHLSVQCSPDDIPGLAPRIRQLIRNLEAPPEDESAE